MVAIADVDSLIPFQSEINQVAQNNTTSVYTPFKIFPMLPPSFSYDLSSLLQDKRRPAVVTSLTVDQHGNFELESIQLALVQNKAKLVYEDVSHFLDEKSDLKLFSSDQALAKKQLTIQFEIAKRIYKHREKEGALKFETAQGEPVFDNNIPIGIKPKIQLSGHILIENIMIAANVIMTRFFIQNNLPIIRRIVKQPKRWPRIVQLAKEKNFKLSDNPDVKNLQKFLIEQRQKDPIHFPDLSLAIIKLIGRGEYILSKPGEKSIGHFDLALIDYAHTTAPNRRYPDLMMQRILKTFLLKKKEHFSYSLLENIAANCTSKEDAASKIERHLFKSFAALILREDIGRKFSAIVTGINDQGTWIRLTEIPVEGKLMSDKALVDVGDHLTVTLVHVDIEKGHIDFK